MTSNEGANPAREVPTQKVPDQMLHDDVAGCDPENDSILSTLSTRLRPYPIGEPRQACVMVGTVRLA